LFGTYLVISKYAFLIAGASLVCLYTHARHQRQKLPDLGVVGHRVAPFRAERKVTSVLTFRLLYEREIELTRGRDIIIRDRLSSFSIHASSNAQTYGTHETLRVCRT
ncbi:hypothetical protein KCU99_g191, partial [Aureobasidium melanogenum]